MLVFMVKGAHQHIFSVQPSYQNTPPFGVSNIPVMGGISGAFGIVDPSRSSAFGDPFRRVNVPSSGKVTFQCLSTTGSLLLGS
jgi:hypothetical protein